MDRQNASKWAITPQQGGIAPQEGGGRRSNSLQEAFASSYTLAKKGKKIPSRNALLHTILGNEKENETYKILQIFRLCSMSGGKREEIPILRRSRRKKGKGGGRCSLGPAACIPCTRKKGGAHKGLPKRSPGGKKNERGGKIQKFRNKNSPSRRIKKRGTDNDVPYSKAKKRGFERPALPQSSSTIGKVGKEVSLVC